MQTTNEVDTESLLTRCREGDELAWEALVRRYQGRVFALALHYTRNREDALDTAQEIFVKVYRQLGGLRDGQAFLPWLLRLGRNCCIDRLRRLKVRTPPIEVAIDQAAPTLATDDPSPEQRGRDRQRRELLQRALGTLSETSREVILLKEIQQLKLEEVAALLQVPVGTVKSRSSRARIELARAVPALTPETGV